MKRLRAPAALCLVLIGAVTAAAAAGDANFVLGGRALDKDFWAPVEDQGVFGVTVDFGPKHWPIRLAAGAMFSGKKEDVSLAGFGFSGSGEFKGGVGEVSFGVLKIWDNPSNVRPYAGAGLALMSARAELEVFGVSVHDDDQSAGVYVQGGVFWRLGERFNIGVDVRALGGTDITLFGAHGDSDYVQAGLVLGWGWR